MSNAITLTIPADDKDAQRAAATFFNTLINGGGIVTASESAPAPKPEPANLGDDAPEPLAEAQPKSEPQESKDADEYPIEVNGVSVDIDRRTWHHEIDSSNKKCYKSGSDAGRWIKRKGVDDSVRAEKVEQLIALAKGEQAAPVEQQEQAQPQQQFNAGQAFGGQQQQQQQQQAQQQAQQTQGFQPSDQAQAVSDPQTFWQFIGTRNFNPDVQSTVCSSFGLSNLSQAVAAMANDKDILGKVAVELERVEAQGA